MDTIRIKEISSASPTAEVASLALAMRERSRGEINIQRLKKQLLAAGEAVVDEEYADFWKGLEGAGIGSLKGARFKWHYSLKEVAKAAINSGGKPKKAPYIKPMAKAQVLRTTLITIGLRRGDAILSIPSEATQDELKIVSDAVLRCR